MGQDSFPGDLGDRQCRTRSWRGLVYPQCFEVHFAFVLIVRAVRDEHPAFRILVRYTAMSELTDMIDGSKVTVSFGAV